MSDAERIEKLEREVAELSAALKRLAKVTADCDARCPDGYGGVSWQWRQSVMQSISEKT